MALEVAATNVTVWLDVLTVEFWSAHDVKEQGAPSIRIAISWIVCLFIYLITILLIIRLSWVDTRVVDFLMTPFYVCQQVCRHPVIFACNLKVLAAGKCPEAGDGQD